MAYQTKQPISFGYEQEKNKWQLEQVTEASIVGDQFAQAIAVVAAGKYDEVLRKKKTYPPFKKLFWEEPQYNPPIGNAHIDYAHDAHHKEESKHWKRIGISFVHAVKPPDRHGVNGPLNPVEIPNLFEQPVKMFGRSRDLKPFARARAYNKPVERNILKEKSYLDDRASRIGPTTYVLPDLWNSGKWNNDIDLNHQNGHTSASMRYSSPPLEQSIFKSGTARFTDIPSAKSEFPSEKPGTSIPHSRGRNTKGGGFRMQASSRSTSDLISKQSSAASLASSWESFNDGGADTAASAAADYEAAVRNLSTTSPAAPSNEPATSIFESNIHLLPPGQYYQISPSAAALQYNNYKQPRKKELHIAINDLISSHDELEQACSENSTGRTRTRNNSAMNNTRSNTGLRLCSSEGNMQQQQQHPNNNSPIDNNNNNNSYTVDGNNNNNHISTTLFERNGNMNTYNSNSSSFVGNVSTSPVTAVSVAKSHQKGFNFVGTGSSASHALFSCIQPLKQAEGMEKCYRRLILPDGTATIVPILMSQLSPSSVTKLNHYDNSLAAAATASAPSASSMQQLQLIGSSNNGGIVIKSTTSHRNEKVLQKGRRATSLSNSAVAAVPTSDTDGHATVTHTDGDDGDINNFTSSYHRGGAAGGPFIRSVSPPAQRSPPPPKDINYNNISSSIGNNNYYNKQNQQTGLLLGNKLDCMDDESSNISNSYSHHNNNAAAAAAGHRRNITSPTKSYTVSPDGRKRIYYRSEESIAAASAQSSSLYSKGLMNRWRPPVHYSNKLSAAAAVIPDIGSPETIMNAATAAAAAISYNKNTSSSTYHPSASSSRPALSRSSQQSRQQFQSTTTNNNNAIAGGGGGGVIILRKSFDKSAASGDGAAAANISGKHHHVHLYPRQARVGSNNNSSSGGSKDDAIGAYNNNSISTNSEKRQIVSKELETILKTATQQQQLESS